MLAIIKCVEDVLMLNGDVEETRVDTGQNTSSEDNNVMLQVLESVFDLVLIVYYCCYYLRSLT